MKQHGWQITEEKFSTKTNLLNETLFTVGNGYIGMRGSFEEGYSGPKGTSVDGTYLNGFYESQPIFYEEPAYGYAKNSQTMLNVANSKIIKLYIEDEEFDMFKGSIIDYKRTLDMKEGILKRELIWKSPKGKKVSINVKRVVSFNSKHCMTINYRVKPLNFNGKVTVLSVLDGNVRNQESSEDPRVGAGFEGQILKFLDEKMEGSFGALMQKTTKTAFTLVCGMENELITDCNFKVENNEVNQRIEIKYIIDAEQDCDIELNKYAAYFTSRDYQEQELMKKTKEYLSNMKKKGFNKIFLCQKEFLKDFWSNCDIEINGDDTLQQGVRFNMFQLLQSTGRDGKTNIAAKGLTGEGYEGHYFWDTEIYIIPFFLYTNPKISRKLLEYRYNTLDKARERASELAFTKGALYPWRTIDGQECSSYYPAGTAQFHINADIVYMVKKYMEVVEDKEFLLDYGAEMIFETARIWTQLGWNSPRKGNKFCINCVTGPDEYTAIVNNNFYTNIMAKMHLEYAYDTAKLLKKKYNVVYRSLCNKISLKEEEIMEWKKTSDNMYLPYNDELKIHPQDDSFLSKKIWDFDNTPKEKYPLLLNYHPLVIYRYQVCKQADTVLALFLLGNKFTKEQKKKDYDYYEPITTHDSSLSTSIFSIIASEIGYYDQAYDYFMKNSRLDLDNYQNNSEVGVHTACMGGTWMCITFGFAGMRVYEGKLSFNPYIPKKWDSYKFKINFKGCLIQVEVNKKAVKYTLIKGEKIELYHKNNKFSLVANVEFSH